MSADDKDREVNVGIFNSIFQHPHWLGNSPTVRATMLLPNTSSRGGTDVACAVCST